MTADLAAFLLALARPGWSELFYDRCDLDQQQA